MMNNSVSQLPDYDLDYILDNLSDLTTIPSQRSSPQAFECRYPATPIQQSGQLLSAVAETPTRPPRRQNPHHGVRLSDAEATESESESESDSDPMDGIESTSSLRHGGRTAKEGRIAKGRKKRQQTLAARRSNYDAVQAQLLLAVSRPAALRHEQPVPGSSRQDDAYFQGVIDDFARRGVTWGDFIEWIARPSSQRRSDLWKGFFINTTQVRAVLNLWATKNSPSAKATMREWAITYVGDILGREADNATKDGALLTRRMPVNDHFVTGFKLTELHSHLSTLCPATTTLMRCFCTTTNYDKFEAKTNKTPCEEAILKRRQAR